jgi:Flp pilus assembly protein TadG
VRSDRAAEDGNTLILMPVAFLVLLVLAALTVDGAAAYLGQRRVADLAAGLANDAVAAVSEQAFYEGGQVAIQDGRARVRRQQVLDTLGRDRTLRDVGCEVTSAGDHATATCWARVEPIFARAVRGGGGRPVRASETARAVQR